MLLYRLLSTCVWLMALARWVALAGAARLTGRARPAGERLLPPPRRTATAPLVWLHGASNGEMTAARPLAEAILARTGADLLITTNNPTARTLVASWGLARTIVRLAPLDAGPPLRAFLDRARPAALVIIENELWPLRLTGCARRGIPVLVAGARMSERSARNWARLPRLARILLDTITWLAPQDEGSQSRLIALGLCPDRIGPILSLKAAAHAAPPAAPPAAPSQARAHTLLAASTHEGEEEVILDAFLAARSRHPDLRLILAPRHPHRGPQIAALIAARGLPLRTRSRVETPDAPVYLADTLGEMDLWYAAAGMTFVGGSLAPRGGHTPFEPAAHGSVLLHGPRTENFLPAYQALARAGAAIPVRDAPSLAAAVEALAGDGAAQSRLARAGAAALAPLRSDAALSDFLDHIARALSRDL